MKSFPPEENSPSKRRNDEVDFHGQFMGEETQSRKNIPGIQANRAQALRERFGSEPPGKDHREIALAPGVGNLSKDVTQVMEGLAQVCVSDSQADPGVGRKGNHRFSKTRTSVSESTPCSISILRLTPIVRRTGFGMAKDLGSF